jgi:hypothetical protein
MRNAQRREYLFIIDSEFGRGEGPAIPGRASSRRSGLVVHKGQVPCKRYCRLGCPACNLALCEACSPRTTASMRGADRSAAAAALNPRDATTGASCVARALHLPSEDSVRCMSVVMLILL